MPSSTSSSETGTIRVVPERPWLRLAAVALAVAVAATAGVEVWARGRGYELSYRDSDDLWVRERRRVEPESLVSVGSSRILFDLDLDAFEEMTGRRPIQLAHVGTSPTPLLHDLAVDETFRGTVLVGVTPSLFFVPGGPLLEPARKVVARRATQSPSQRWGQWLSMPLEARLVLLNEDLALRKLLERPPVPSRPGQVVYPGGPPWFGVVAKDRGIRMAKKMDDPAFQREVQEVWRGLVGMAPDLPPEVVLGGRDAVLAGVVADVEAIRARGGKVVFIRFPSTGFFAEYEAEHQPRAAYWDLLLERTGAPGVHYEDHPELTGFDCPEWSHLTAPDATRFTRALVPHLEPHL